MNWSVCCLVQAVVSLCHAWHAVAVGPFDALLCHLLGIGRVVVQALQGLGQCLGIGVRHEYAAAFDHLAQAVDARGYERTARGHAFDRGERESLGV